MECLGPFGINYPIIRNKIIVQVFSNSRVGRSVGQVSTLMISQELPEKEVPSTPPPSSTTSKRQGRTQVQVFRHFLVSRIEYLIGVVVLRKQRIHDELVSK